MNKLRKEQINAGHIVTISNNQWDYTRNCTVVFDATVDDLVDLPVFDGKSRAIKLDQLIYLGLRQMVMNKLLGKY